MDRTNGYIKGKDPRPADFQHLVNRFRKVQPVSLNGSSASGTKISKSALARTQSGLAPYSGTWEGPQVTHLLRRALFGIKRSELASFKNLSPTAAVDLLLTPATTPDPPINYYNNPGEGVIDPFADFGESWINAPYANEYEGRRIVSLKSWLIGNILSQEASLHEKLILFWHNLLATQSWGIFISKASYQYFDMLRRNAFGNFKTLIRELTLDPAMLIYLNGTQNNKEAPDENYARELQELFCIGKGPNAAFTEGDVQAAARVLTGWIINWNQVNEEGPVSSLFWSDIHDTSDKQFSEFYGNRVISGRSGSAGAEELDELLDMIIDNQETALYICRRLYQFFVYSEVDEDAEQNVIVPLADILRANNYEVLPVLEALLKSEHFFDERHYGALIKNPVDHLLGLWRSLEVQSPDPANLVLQDAIHRSMLWNMANKGLEIADPPSVSGWPAYYQAPGFDKAWITTDTISSRAITSDSLVYWGFWVYQGMQIPADLLEFVEGFTAPADPNLLLADLSELLFGTSLATNELDQLKTILLSGQREDYYWSNAWYDYENNPGNGEYKLVVENRLKSLFQRVFQRGEFHLM
ncbi:MAG: DUF1800 domain-containing protein [Cyclobacteriaceae bacterium]|nr:DUF1800 domain-containing protein [Cyclobacteriaceae bacterium]